MVKLTIFYVIKYDFFYFEDRKGVDPGSSIFRLRFFLRPIFTSSRKDTPHAKATDFGLGPFVWIFRAVRIRSWPDLGRIHDGRLCQQPNHFGAAGQGARHRRGGSPGAFELASHRGNRRRSRHLGRPQQHRHANQSRPTSRTPFIKLDHRTGPLPGRADIGRHQ